MNGKLNLNIIKRVYVAHKTTMNTIGYDEKR